MIFKKGDLVMPNMDDPVVVDRMRYNRYTTPFVVDLYNITTGLCYCKDAKGRNLTWNVTRFILLSKANKEDLVIEKIKYLRNRYEQRTHMGLGNNNLQQGKSV